MATSEEDVEGFAKAMVNKLFVTIGKISSPEAWLLNSLKLDNSSCDLDGTSVPTSIWVILLANTSRIQNQMNAGDPPVSHFIYENTELFRSIFRTLAIGKELTPESQLSQHITTLKCLKELSLCHPVDRLLPDCCSQRALPLASILGSEQATFRFC